MEIAEIVNLVETKHKRIGLRMLYAKHKVKEEDRPMWRELWDAIKGELDARSGMQENISK